MENTCDRSNVYALLVQVASGINTNEDLFFTTDNSAHKTTATEVERIAFMMEWVFVCILSLDEPLKYCRFNTFAEYIEFPQQTVAESSCLQ